MTQLKPIQYLLCGIPFSGKSTLGRLLADKLEMIHVNLDDVKRDMGYQDVNDDDVPDEAWPIIIAKADQIALASLRQGKSVAHETAWVTKEWRERARALASNEGFETKIIWIQTPPEIIEQRRASNRKSKERYDTNEDEFQGYVEEFEPPGVDEHVLIYDGVEPMADWIERIFRL